MVFSKQLPLKVESFVEFSIAAKEADYKFFGNGVRDSVRIMNI